MAGATPTTPYEPTQDERTIACISHLTIFVSTIGWFIAIGIWIYARQRQPYAAFQAAQAVIFQFVAMVLSFVVVFVVVVIMFGALGFGMIWASQLDSGVFAVFASLMVFLMIGVILMFSLLFYAYAIYAAVLCYRGQPFRMPGIGALAHALQPMPPIVPPREAHAP
jgi:uncharacterized Tic20 family protein